MRWTSATRIRTEEAALRRIAMILVGVALPVAFALVASARSDVADPVCYFKMDALTDGGSSGGFANADAAFAAGGRSWKVGDLGVERHEHGAGSVHYTLRQDRVLQEEAIASRNESGAWFILETARKVPCSQVPKLIDAPEHR